MKLRTHESDNVTVWLNGQSLPPPNCLPPPNRLALESPAPPSLLGPAANPLAHFDQFYR